LKAENFAMLIYRLIFRSHRQTTQSFLSDSWMRRTHWRWQTSPSEPMERRLFRILWAFHKLCAASLELIISWTFLSLPI